MYIYIYILYIYIYVYIYIYIYILESFYFLFKTTFYNFHKDATSQ